MDFHLTYVASKGLFPGWRVSMHARWAEPIAMVDGHVFQEQICDLALSLDACRSSSSCWVACSGSVAQQTMMSRLNIGSKASASGPHRGKYVLGTSTMGIMEAKGEQLADGRMGNINIYIS